MLIIKIAALFNKKKNRFFWFPRLGTHWRSGPRRCCPRPRHTEPRSGCPWSCRCIQFNKSDGGITKLDIIT